MDQLVLSVLALSADLGQYAVAVSIAGVAAPVYSALATSVIPAVSGAAGPRDGAREAIRHMWWAVVTSVPVVLVGTLGMGWAIQLAFGREFHLAVLPARILLIAGVFQGLNAILGNGLRSLGNPGAAAVAEGCGLVATVVLLAVLLRPLGIVGAAVASLSSYGIVTGILLSYAVRAARRPAREPAIEGALAKIGQRR
jgi:O-antigen/teichoic acid export membrane protein